LSSQHFSSERLDGYVWDATIRDYPDGDREAYVYPRRACGGGEKGALDRAIGEAYGRGDLEAVRQLEKARVHVREASARRASAQVRRVVKASAIRIMWTFTFPPPGCQDYAQAVDIFTGFIRRLQRHHRGVYLWVGELHKEHGWHFHMGVRHYIRVEGVRLAWTRWLRRHGFPYHGHVRVHVVESKTTRRIGSYLSKYLGKTFEQDAIPAGRHRYRPGDGCSRPGEQVVSGTTVDQMHALVEGLSAGDYAMTWWKELDVWCFRWQEGVAV
jgi:hypothetical protein